MDIACNYSAPLLDLIGENRVEIDYIKLSRIEILDREMAAARPVRPVLLHTLTDVGKPFSYWDSYDFDLTNRYIAEAGSPHIAVHLNIDPRTNGHDYDRRRQSDELRDRLLEETIGKLRMIASRLETELLIENAPYYGFRGTLSCTAEPGFIAAVIAETGCGLLLDTSHARCSADHFGMTAETYLSSLPLDSIKEIHTVGPRFIDGEGLRDMHYELLDEDYRILEWTLGRSAPRVLTLEYSGTGPDYETPEKNSKQALERQLRRLTRIRNRTAEPTAR